MFRYTSSIRKTLVVALICLAIFPTLVMGTILMWRSIGAELKHSQDLQQEFTKRSLEKISSYMHEQETALMTLVVSSNLTRLSHQEQYNHLSGFRSGLKDEHHRDIYDQLILLDGQGKELVHVSRTSIYTEADITDSEVSTEFERVANSRTIYYSPVHFNKETGEPLMNISIPLLDPATGKVNGALIAVIRVKFMWNVVAEIDLCGSCIAFIVDPSGMVVAHPNPSVVLKGTFYDIPRDNGNGITTGIEGDKVIMASDELRLGNQSMNIVTQMPVREALQNSIYMLVAVGVIFVIAVLSAVALGYILVRQVVRPIESLAETAEAVSAGNLSSRNSIRRNDEIGVLADAFNNMTSRLVESINSLKNEKDKLKIYLDTAAIMVVILDKNWKIELINNMGCNILGYRNEEALGKDWFEIFVPLKVLEETREVHSKLMEGDYGKLSYYEYPVLTKSGEERLIAWYNTVLRDEKGEATSVLCSGIDITESRTAERKILEQNELIRNTLESLTHPFYVIDASNYRIKVANSACHFGELTEESTCYALTHRIDHPCEGADHPCTIIEVKKYKKPVTLEHTHRDLEGHTQYVEVHGYPIFDGDGEVSSVIEYNIDVTERKKLEEQLLQAQKMESIGRLAGGVAHDFNNLLSAILGYGEISLGQIPEDSPVKNYLQIIVDAGNKASALTRQLLAFSRKQVLDVRVTNLNSIVSSMTKILRRIIGEDVAPEFHLTSARNIKVDASQIEQVVLNLVVNARDAMPCGGRVIIETSDIDLDEEYAKSHGDVVPGPYSMLAVTDSGEGMSREVQEKIFEPFYTTKGKFGTGLGLSTVYGIVKQHNAHIFVYSEPSVGTTFKIYFPATPEAAETVASKEYVEEVHGTETVLVVDDEKSIRSLAVDTLAPLGYKTYEASCGDEAIQVCQKLKTEGGAIDILLTDVVMPGMSGRELGDALKGIFPDARVLYMSGYTENVIASHGMLSPNVNFIQKPITPGNLARRLREVLRREVES